MYAKHLKTKIIMNLRRSVKEIIKIKKFNKSRQLKKKITWDWSRIFYNLLYCISLYVLLYGYINSTRVECEIYNKIIKY